ncbi:Hypothetical protein AA314_10093 [Archangium gephyra]|uniref:Uncharacterized protein n=1 Tax=Archangium gephyra TaxID=48 RepID=A0AAC8QIS0_9BACT|nr:Hypothetical protein AA314_10093 [Archangium gephyra]
MCTQHAMVHQLQHFRVKVEELGFVINEKNGTHDSSCPFLGEG